MDSDPLPPTSEGSDDHVLDERKDKLTISMAYISSQRLIVQTRSNIKHFYWGKTARS